MTTIVYDHDESGVNPANLVRGETHVLTELNDRVYRIIVPKFAPFFLTGVSVKFIENNGTVRTLVQGVDYQVVYRYQAASMSIGKMLFGAISIKTTLINGTISLSYQTLGGKWVADQAYVLERLAENIYNPRTAYWDQLTNVQETYPPSPHGHPMDDLTGYQDLIDAVNRITLYLEANANDGGFKALLDHHTGERDVHGIPLDASDDEVQSRQLEDKLVTLRQIITYLIPSEDYFTDQTERLEVLEDQSGSLGSRVSELELFVDESTSNPPTKDSIGLGNLENLELATNEDIEDLSPLSKYITLEQAIKLFLKLEGVTPTPDPEHPSSGDKDPTRPMDWLVPTAESYYLSGQWATSAIELYLQPCK